MSWKPIVRICAACGLSIAVVIGEEREHVHVETYAPPLAFTTNLYVAVTSAPVLNVSDWPRDWLRNR
jgi:hypothetical protein